MLELLKVRIKQGRQFIPDLAKAEVREPFRGFPLLDPAKCNNCQNCKEICPTQAIETKPLSLDLGKCVFCGDCVRECGAVSFSNFHKTAATSRAKLIIKAGMTPEKYYPEAVKANAKIKKIFGRSLKLRQVSAGGCNACELELNACANVNFDMGRFGLEFVASPRHADGIVITGPLTANMAGALRDTYLAVPKPKLVILAGSCAISGGLFTEAGTLERNFLRENKVDLFIPGCPIHPLTFIDGVLRLIGRF